METIRPDKTLPAFILDESGFFFLPKEKKSLEEIAREYQKAQRHLSNLGDRTNIDFEDNPRGDGKMIVTGKDPDSGTYASGTRKFNVTENEYKRLMKELKRKKEEEQPDRGGFRLW